MYVAVICLLVYTFMYVHVHTCICTCTCTYMYVYMYVYMCIYLCTDFLDSDRYIKLDAGMDVLGHSTDQETSETVRGLTQHMADEGF